VPSSHAHHPIPLPATRQHDGTPPLRLPLNQLTWPEVARMVLVAEMMTEDGREVEEIQHVLRGSRLPSYRLAKNVARQVRPLPPRALSLVWPVFSRGAKGLTPHPPPLLGFRFVTAWRRGRRAR